MYNALLTILVLKGICSYDEAEAIAEKLNNTVVPAKFRDAYADVEAAIVELIPQAKKH